MVSWEACKLLDQPPLNSGKSKSKGKGKALYPNPATDFVKVDLNFVKTDILLEIYDLSGKSVLILQNQQTDEMGILRVELENLP